MKTLWRCVQIALVVTYLIGACQVQAAGGCPSPSFSAPLTFPVGAYPASIVAGDFNLDGKLDLAVANQFCDDTNQSCNSISVLLGNGNGTFQAASNYPAGPYPQSIVTGDFNGDNKLDLVVANSTIPGTVTRLLGNGNGTFGAGMSFSTGDTPGAVACGDFNHDNKLDLAVGNFINSPSGTISVLLGKGDGTFYAKTNYDAGRYPESVAVGDFNEDTHLDLAVAKQAGVVLLLGNGNGTFQSLTNVASLTFPESVTVGDFNQDGNADIAVVNDTASGQVVLLRGLGNGSFMAATNFATGSYPISLKASDYNNDGQPDFAVGDDTGVSVLLGATTGTFQLTSGFGYVTNSYYLTTGDFNGDGAPDLAAVNYASAGTVSVLLNNCSAVPSLAVLRSNAFVRVSWPFPSSGFVLESATNVGAVGWPAATETATTNSAGRWEITAPINQSQRFFRLHKTN